MSIRIVTDSNCDLPQGIIDDYGITVVPMYINIGSESYLDGVTMSRQEFYEGLPSFDSHPMTSVPGPGAFIEIFDRLADEGATEIREGRGADAVCVGGLRALAVRQADVLLDDAAAALQEAAQETTQPAGYALHPTARDETHHPQDGPGLRTVRKWRADWAGQVFQFPPPYARSRIV